MRDTRKSWRGTCGSRRWRRLYATLLHIMMLLSCASVFLATALPQATTNHGSKSAKYTDIDKAADVDDDKTIWLSKQQRSDGLDGELEQKDSDLKASFPMRNDPSKQQQDSSTRKSVLIVASIDGSLTGFEKETGELLWKQRDSTSQSDFYTAPSGDNDDEQENIATKNKNKETRAARQSSVLTPLLSTTTTTKSSTSASTSSGANSLDSTLAVPWTDGRVSLTARDVTVTTTMAELVDRAPFVDARGRLYTASRHATAFLLDASTGQVFRQEPLSIDGTRAGALLKAADLRISGLYSSNDVDQQDDLQADTIWLGRVDETVSLYEPRSGQLDAQVSTARIMGMQEMMLERQREEEEYEEEDTSNQRPEGVADSVSRHRVHGRRKNDLLAPAVGRDEILVAAPNGMFALADAKSGKVQWIAKEHLSAAVAYVIDSDTGSSLPITMVQDAVITNGSAEYMVRELEQQLQRLIVGSFMYGEEVGFDVNDEQSIVGALPNGQLFAMSLPNRQHDNLYQTRIAAMNAPPKSLHVASGIGGHRQQIQRSSQNHYERYKLGRRLCRPGSADFPACMSHPEEYMRDYDDDDQSFLADVNGDGSVVAFYRGHGYDMYPEHYFTLPHYDEQRHRELRRYRRLFRLVGSWLPPLIALVFVLSFEMGRRKRQREAKALENHGVSVDHATNVGLIKVFDDSVLGYGGHGTVVYKGSLEGRLVAVKRMLRAYHASADREISLLIESDGHQNVVRYFLKEVRGEFVYLALEMCDLSLHDLILALVTGFGIPEKENTVPVDKIDAVKNILFQIASGVHHLHSLLIIHRDLKPMNILLAASRSSKEDSQEVLPIFLRHGYVAKISDMGLGKQLLGQSSFGASLIAESIRGQSNGAQSSVAGIGPGSVGWQAPEVMGMRMSSDVSARSDESGKSFTDSNSNSTPPIDATINARTSRAVDIFSLGCVFYSTLVPGSHPFGEWYEREANIMHNRPDISPLKALSPDAHDLIRGMIQRNPLSRPTAKQVRDHPFFWADEERLNFLSDFSDRIESDATDDQSIASDTPLTVVVERNASDVVGLSWDIDLEPALVNNVVRFRTYDPSSVRDLLRLIRNKSHHFDELPSSLRIAMNNSVVGLVKYFEQRFPGLVIHCYDICCACLPKDDALCIKYDIVPVGRISDTRVDVQVSTITENTGEVHRRDEFLPLNREIRVHDADLKTQAHVTDEAVGIDCSLMNEPIPQMVSAQLVTDASSASTVEKHHVVELPPAGDIVVWEASTAAKTFNCRGWSRSDDEWQRRVVDSAIRRRDNKDLIRCSEDPRFRTRLCNHWSLNCGMSCPMRVKRKCIFAHGPVELRVKEGKRNRWGKLVDVNGDNSNQAHSGGEDTYGIAKSIEAERTSQGKCNIEKNVKTASKNSATKKKRAPKLEDEATLGVA